MHSSITYPMSVMQAYRLYLDNPIYEKFQAKNPGRCFDNFLSEVTFVFPCEMACLSEGQVHDLVALWVRIRGADAKVKGHSSVLPLSTGEIVQRLAVLNRLTDCLPAVDGLLTEAYWASFVNLCAEMYGVLMEDSSSSGD